MLMFNTYTWNLYLDAGGKDFVDFLKKNYSKNISPVYVEKIANLHQSFCPSRKINDLLKEELSDSVEVLNQDYYFFEDRKYTIDRAMKYLYNLFIKENEGSEKITFDDFSSSLAYYTTLLSYELPDLFIPYYFKYNFNILEKIFVEFNISLPEIPKKSDYKARFFYYGEICKSLSDFREENYLSPYELIAFLYDFAPKYVGGIDSYIIKDLPAPNACYLIGSSKDDMFLSNEVDNITPWQCSPDIKAGDNVLMYVKYPISAIDSIWTSVSIGFIDPFFYYYRCTYISNPRKIKKLTLSELKEDEIFKNLPIVRKNMQGLNGVELLPSAFNHLLEIRKLDIPRLEYFIMGNEMEIAREKDVENKLIKPFLKRLAYSDSDYIQQLYIKVGNNNHLLIPDFVINPSLKSSSESCDIIIEAKFSIGSKRELENARIQVRSYAKILSAKYALVSSKESIWVFSFRDDYKKVIISFTWSDLEDEDNFYKIYKLIAKDWI